MLTRGFTHIRQEEQGHGGLTFLTLVAVLIMSMSALVIALSSGSDANDAQTTANSVDTKMAEAQAEMDSNLRSLKELGSAVDQLQEDLDAGLTQAMTSQAAASIQGGIQISLANIQASIARTEANLTALKADVSNQTTSLATARGDIALEQVKVATLERSLANLRRSYDATVEEVARNQTSILVLEDALEQTITETSTKLAYAAVGNVFLIWWNHGLVGKELVTQEVDLAVAATNDAELQTAWEAVRNAQTSFGASPNGIAFQVLIRETDPFLELLAKKLIAASAS